MLRVAAGPGVPARLRSRRPLTYLQARVPVTGYDVNRPDPYPGMGDFGWTGNLQRLPSGDLILVHQWGYWHSSFAEPRMIEPEWDKRWRSQGWPLDFKAPTGGRCMATFSSDNGRTWSQPKTMVDLRMDDSPQGVVALSGRHSVMLHQCTSFVVRLFAGAG